MQGSSKFSPHDPTLDALPLAASEHGSLSPSPAACQVALVEGSTPELSAEIQSLLRSRLRTAAIILAIGFGIFFVRTAFVVNFDHVPDLVLWLLSGLVFSILGVQASGLCRRCKMSTSKLRLMEMLVFGLPAVYFLAGSIVTLMALHRAEAQRELHVPTLAFQKVPAQTSPATQPPDSTSLTVQENQVAVQIRVTESPSVPWMMLIFVYAMYIPNTWRRAAVVIGLMAAVPVMTHFVALLVSEPLRRVFTWNGLVGVTMVMGALCLGRRVGSLHHRALAQRSLSSPTARAVSPDATHRRGRHGRGLSCRASDDEAAGGHQGHPSQSRHRSQRACAFRARSAGHFALVALEHDRDLRLRLHRRWDVLLRHGVSARLEHCRVSRAARSLAAGASGLPFAANVRRVGRGALAGFIHRDIKPGNIFAAQRGGHYDVAKLLDFGLAKPMFSTTDSVHLTGEGSITGSPLYMPPEQATGEGEPDARSDIYALGAVAYCMLTGRAPFTGDNAVRIMIAHASQDVKPPSAYRSDIPADVEAIVLRCLAKHPADRFQDTASLAAALAACDCAGRWTRTHAAEWWAALQPKSANGQPSASPLEPAGIS